ncbi:MAG: hypothetical protein ACYDBQ_12215 [Thermoplasmatota archaeon]
MGLVMTNHRLRYGFTLSLLLGLASLTASPVALGTLAGSGQINDVLSLTVSTGTLAASTLASAAFAPVVDASSFTATNSNSNIDSFVLYAWGTTPYYGTSSSQTSIAVRGTTYQIGDLLWFKESATPGGGSATVSQYFSPLLVKNSASITRATFTTAGNACTSWTGTPAVGFIATSAGTLTFKYYDSTTQTDDTPSTTASYNFCLDTTNDQVYLGTTTAYGSNTLIKVYTTNSVLGVLQPYQYEFLPGSYTHGNLYCLTSFTGSGTAATPDLGMCQKMSYQAAASSTAQIFPMFDPPAAFPSDNQLGTTSGLTYGASGTQFNPYATGTTNSA